uniref:EamA domain-containing protein n=1 Tax=Leucosporidium scottii TaxID=5278 RepID=A0A0H5FU61_9BASI
MPLFPASSALAWKAGALLCTLRLPLSLPRLLADQVGGEDGYLVALLAISQHPVYCKRWSAPLIIAGTTLFSGSIFALLLFKDRMGGFARVVGPTTPIGGLLMISGYLSLVSPEGEEEKSEGKADLS